MIWIAAVCSSIAYRWGRASKDEIPFANSQIRDIGCPLIVAGILAMHFPWYIALACGALVCIFIRIYWGWKCGKNNLYLHGLGIGASFIPFYWYGVDWWQIAIYTAILSLSFGILNWAVNKFHVKHAVWIEELYRGFALIAFMCILI